MSTMVDRPRPTSKKSLIIGGPVAVRPPRSRSRSPRGYEEELEEPPAEPDEPREVDTREGAERLERHEGAQRDTRPAWMTKGLGVNTEIFGETRGDLVKPGMTQADLDALAEKVQRRSDSPDPLGDFFNDRDETDLEPPKRPPCDPVAFGGAPMIRLGGGAAPASVAAPASAVSAIDIEEAHSILIDLAIHALSRGGYMEGHRLSKLFSIQHPDMVTRMKGIKSWLRLMLEPVPDIKLGNMPERGGPVYYLDFTGQDPLPTEPSEAFVEGDKIPLVGTAKLNKAKGEKKDGKVADVVMGANTVSASDLTVPELIDKLAEVNWRELTEAAVDCIQEQSSKGGDVDGKVLMTFLNERCPSTVADVKGALGPRGWLKATMSLDARIVLVGATSFQLAPEEEEY